MYLIRELVTASVVKGQLYTWARTSTRCGVILASRHNQTMPPAIVSFWRLWHSKHIEQRRPREKREEGSGWEGQPKGHPGGKGREEERETMGTTLLKEAMWEPLAMVRKRKKRETKACKMANPLVSETQAGTTFD